MSNELRIAAKSGLTFTCDVRQVDNTLIANVALAENAATGHYYGNMPGASAQLVDLIYIESSLNRGTETKYWDGSALLNLNDALTATGFSTHNAAAVRTEMDSNSTQLAAIVADTNELQTDDVPGLIAALNNLSIANVETAITNQEPIDANIIQVMGASVSSVDDFKASLSGFPTAVEIREEMDANSIRLLNILADTDELQQDDVPGLIAALNNLGTSDIDSRLAAYGVATLSNLTSAFTEIKGVGWSSIATLKAIQENLDAADLTIADIETAIQNQEPIDANIVRVVGGTISNITDFWANGGGSGSSSGLNGSIGAMGSQIMVNMSGYVEPLLRDRTDLERFVALRMRDPDNKRWRKHEIYRSIATVLNNWGNRVFTPELYPLDVQSGVTSYSIPDYISGPYLLERFTSSKAGGSGNWNQVENISALPSKSTDGTVCLDIPSMGYFYDTDTGSARLIWWGSISPCPDFDTTLGADIADDATSITVQADYAITRSGYLRIGDEYLHYAGVAQTGNGIMTLSGLTRGLQQTTAVAHTSGNKVDWCVSVPNSELWEHLFNGVALELHRLLLTDAANHERTVHEKMVKYYMDAVDKFWQGWQPNRHNFYNSKTYL